MSELREKKKKPRYMVTFTHATYNEGLCSLWTIVCEA